MNADAGSFEVDLASDTKTRPSDAMRRCMCSAPVGDEQRREDPTVEELEQRVARLAGKPAALFLPSGTMCNIIAFYLHCRPGDEVFTHRDSHVVYGELDGPAIHSRVALKLLDGPRGTVAPETLAAALAGDRVYGGRPRGRLLSLENSHNLAGGAVWPLDALAAVCEVAHAAGMATHLDGARLLNAVVASGVGVAEYGVHLDSLWIDLSKGLGCPVGAVLAGDEAFIEEARTAKRLFGGGMRQSGILAAAGIYALDENVERLRDDHRRARELAHGLRDVPGVSVDADALETNILHFDISASGVPPAQFLQHTARLGVRFGQVRGATIRAVTHLDIHDEHPAIAVAAVREALASGGEAK